MKKQILEFFFSSIYKGVLLAKWPRRLFGHILQVELYLFPGWEGGNLMLPDRITMNFLRSRHQDRNRLSATMHTVEDP